LHLLGKTTDLHVSIIEEIHEAPDDVREAFSEAYSALENAIYEFRKRRDRAAAHPERARAPVAWRIDGKHPNGSGHVGWWTDMRHEADEYAAKNVDGFVWRVVPLYAARIATLPEQILASTPDEATNGPSQEGAAGSDATLPDGDAR
jgi:hypothetical protein